MGAPHEQHPKPRQRNRQFRTDLQLSRTRSSDCRLRPEFRVCFRAKSCSIGLTSNGFAPANPTRREIPVPLILSFTCVQSPQESHNPRSDAACVHTADNTQSLRGQRLRGKHQQTHRQKRSCDGLKMPYPPRGYYTCSHFYRAVRRVVNLPFAILLEPLLSSTCSRRTFLSVTL